MLNPRKGVMTSCPHVPSSQGLSCVQLAGTKSCDTVSWNQPQKAGLSSDLSLQLDSMKSESLVIADQHAAVITFPGRGHTARHTTGVDWSRSA